MNTITIDTAPVEFSTRTWKVALRAVYESNDILPALFLTDPLPPRDDGKGLLPISVHIPSLENRADCVWIPVTPILKRLVDQLKIAGVISKKPLCIDETYQVACYHLTVTDEEHMLVLFDYLEHRTRLERQRDIAEGTADEETLTEGETVTDQESYHREQRKVIGYAFYLSLLRAETLEVESQNTPDGYRALHKIHGIPVAMLEINFREQDSMQRMEVSATTNEAEITKYFPNANTRH